MIRQEAFREREKTFHNWQTAQTNLAKKREQEAKLKSTGKTEKLPQVEQEIKDVSSSSIPFLVICLFVFCEYED